MTLHSGDACTISGSQSLGTLQSDDCNQNHGFGCSITTSSSTSYGDSFNTASGGVYATQWTSDYIRIWFFPRSSIPSNIISGNPDPSTWGLPDANFQGNCDIDELFMEHQIVFDTTFCGDWAGGVWSGDQVCNRKADTCAEYVASKPEAFKDAYWDINYVKVFTFTDTPAPTSTKSISISKSTSAPISTSTSTSKSASISTSKGTTTTYLTITPQPSSPTTSFPPFPTSPQNSTIPKLPRLQGWTYIGCLSSPTSSFTSFILSNQNENMTIPLCASSCGSSAYLGIFSTSCYCGSELTDTLPMSDTQCTILCPGSSTQACGGLKTNINTKDKRSGHDHPLGRRQGPDFLPTVYQNQALLPNGVTPSSSQVIIIEPTPDPSEVHFAPTTGEIPTPTISLVPVSMLIGVPMGGSADPASSTSEVHTTSLPTGVVVRVESVTTSASTSVNVSPAGTLIGIGLGGRLNKTSSSTEKVVETTYTTVVTTTYTDLCGCAASTLQAYTITSTLTITHCGCTDTKTVHAHSSGLHSHEIPMTTMTRICADCGIDGTVIVTIPCAEPTLLPLTPNLPHPVSSPTGIDNDNTDKPSPATNTEIANPQAVGAEPQTTHVKIETVTVLPQPLNASVPGSESGSHRGNETLPVSNRAEGVELQWRWGVCTLLGLAGVVVWIL
ncbi:hypothetical protein DL95DRAFT_165993 [Leptodontidium sp. 2 PMI_412]|nr:hypothetical protein DL95DRAFT_165993 [Leptodontidium sp. 2 PMI_412]